MGSIHLRHCGTIDSLVFAADVEHTRSLHEEFIKVGIKATYIIGDTDKKERESRLAAFAKNEFQVMINAMVLTEGYDNKNIQYIFMARPTTSTSVLRGWRGNSARLIFFSRINCPLPPGN